MKQALVKNAASEEQVRRAEATEKFARDAEANDLRWVLSAQQGRRFLWRLLGECGVYRSSFMGGATDSTLFNEGRRSAGIQIQQWITEVSPEGYIKMMQEAHTRENTHE